MDYEDYCNNNEDISNILRDKRTKEQTNSNQLKQKSETCNNLKNPLYIWNIYFNNNFEDFSYACRENRIVNKDEVIELRFESLSE